MAGALLKYFQNKETTKLTPDRTVEDVENEIKTKAIEKDQFLADMSQIESTGGQNTNHKTILGGIHAGEAAVGQYGLMPNTINEIANRMKMENSEPYELHMMRITGTPDQEKAKEVSSDPELEKKIADRLYKHVNAKYAGDKEKMNHAWQFGHNTPADKITPEKLESSPRTQKFRKLQQKLSSK